MEPERVDLVIIGAGWHGLAAAKTALTLDPRINLVVLESAASVGGAWAEERLYTGLRTNNLLGSYEYSDFPMRDNVPASLVKPGEHIPGRAMHEYLKAYAEQFGFRDKIRLNCRVDSVEYCDGGEDKGGGKEWLVGCTTGGHEKSCIIQTQKLILATGLTSQPRLPTFPGQESFGVPLFHFKDLARYQDTLFAKHNNHSTEVQHEHGGSLADKAQAPITVLGGSKSAWDAVYACASKGHRVNWVIRPSGTGPGWMSAAAVFWPLNLLLESLPSVRALGWFSPCIWVRDPVRSFLHATWPGRMLVRLFWAALEWDMVKVNRYSDHEETAKLRPWVGSMWVATAVGILNFPSDLFSLIREGLVKVHIADVERLEHHTVVLSDNNNSSSSTSGGGDRLDTRALILCTGWKASPGIRFLPEGIEQELGLPWAADPVNQAHVRQARKDICTRLPMLRSFPESKGRAYNATDDTNEETVLHPFRLARFVVPPGLWDDHSIAFLGTVTTFNTAIMTEVQALWALVYLNNGRELNYYRAHLQEEDKEAMIREIALHTEFCALRSPADHGARNAAFIFEVMPYLDLLLGDLGLRTARKGSWWANLFVRHQPRDYAGLVEEWKARLLSKSSEGHKMKTA
ncbi:hypothetical protein BDV36DRAFT_292294 [Aspergillus pseudocaelatus]|uniref:Uncharacterized protein n=1 Tax=Aspergillus pseudocaelatus TaxID=1825620 RepID=A0ABQ6WW91_9EURO|nr:hypothetical protein BDV36DRAFT_292294 [Aspergillus pseudocaelatus]